MSGPDATRPAELRSIDMNADLGEGFANDRALLELVTSANICCGAHAGTTLAIRETLRDAAARGVCIGAHPGYPDREGFGRREQKLSTLEAIDLISGQINELMSLAAEVDAKVRYLKPHGALYNQAGREPEIAGAVVAAVAELRPATAWAAGKPCREAGARLRGGLHRRGFPRPPLPRRRFARSPKRARRVAARTERD